MTGNLFTFLLPGHYLFTDDSTYRMEVEGQCAGKQYRSLSPDGYTNRYPADRGSRQAETLGDRRECRAALTARRATYIGIGGCSIDFVLDSNNIKLYF